MQLNKHITIIDAISELCETNTIDYLLEKLTISIIERNHISKENISMIIFAGSDKYTQPSDATFIANILGVNNCLAFSINNSCASMLTAIEIAKNYIFVNEFSVVLIVGVGNLKNCSENNNQSNYVNGVSCLILKKDVKGFNVFKTVSQTNGEYYGLKVLIPNSKTNLNVTDRQLLQICDLQNIKWNQYRESAAFIPVKLFKETLSTVAWNISSLSLIGFHQSNLSDKWLKQLPELKNKEIFALNSNQRVNLGAASTGFILSRIFESVNSDKFSRIAFLEIGLGMVSIVTLLEKIDYDYR